MYFSPSTSNSMSATVQNILQNEFKERKGACLLFCGIFLFSVIVRIQFHVILIMFCEVFRVAIGFSIVQRRKHGKELLAV